MALTLLIVGIAFNIFLGLLVSLKQKDKAARLLAYVALAMIGWEISNYFADKASQLTLFWNRITFAWPVLIMLLSYVFIMVLKSEKINVKRLTAIIATSFCVVVGCLSHGVVVGVSHRVIGGVVEGFNPVYGSLYPFYVGWLGFLVILYSTALIKGRAKEDPIRRSQMKLIRTGSLFAVSLPAFTNILLPNLTGTSYASRFVPLTSIIFMGTLSITILKHRLFDIRTFALRAAAYSASIVILIVLCVLPIVFMMIFLFDISLDMLDFAIVVAVVTIAAVNYDRLRRSFDKKTNRFFFRDKYDPAELLSELNKELVSTIELNGLLQKASVILNKSLRPEHLTYLITDKGYSKNVRVLGSLAGSFRDGYELIQRLSQTHDTTSTETVTLTVNVYKKNFKKQLTDNDIAVIARLNTDQESKKELLGCVLLGPRKSGKVYDMQDLQVLDAVANTLVIAMQNALHFEEIENFNATLQQQVEEQTRKYRAANERLKKLDETKDEFISMASHQLRTPLTSIKGYLSMVLEGDAGKLNEQQEQMLQQSFLSSERMVNLIADLLNLSRLNTGKFVIDATPTDLRMIVDQEVSQLRETAKAKNIELTYEMPPTFTMINLDENKIHQVVMNFIDNALYYTPPGGKVTVALIETPTAIEYRVTDTGIGVPRDLQHHLFSKFYRADNARRMRPDGTGLGLYMAKKIVVAQGGSIIFKSIENVGSTFGFRFVKAHVGAMPTTVADDSTETAKR